MKVCVFCGSSLGDNPIYKKTAQLLGHKLAQAGYHLIYGGGRVGLMGALADAVLEANGNVTGVIPDFLLKREAGHKGVTDLEVVETMHERKKRMADLSDAFIAMPGGWGTLDELAEILTWRQLGLINNPIYILNIQSFFEPLLAQMKSMEKEGFLRPDNMEMLQIADSVEELILLLQSNQDSLTEKNN